MNAELLYISIALLALIILALIFLLGKKKSQPMTPFVLGEDTKQPQLRLSNCNRIYTLYTTRYNIGPLSDNRPPIASPVASNKGDPFWAKTRNNPLYVVPTSARSQATPSITINMANLNGTSQNTPSVSTIASTSSSSPQIFVADAPFLLAPPPYANTQSSSVPALQDIQFSSHPRPAVVTTMQDESASET
ncbi:MAG: hypothetical protein JOS17DRAFT_843361 [Linnemannia elongata]|nr:MAG: hypothetical protein JOS17DRAFT_843361 [Linnemannia elongata]